jgi:hypothetical protein
MKKLLTTLGVALIFAVAVFAMTACPGGNNAPNNPKGQAVSQPSGGTPPAGGSDSGDGEAMPAGGD